MKLPRIAIFFINLSVILGGIIFVFTSTFADQKVWNVLFEAMGTSLIATGGVNLLSQFFTERPNIVGVRMIAGTRNTLDKDIHDRKYRANKIDVVGISLSGFLQELSNNMKIAERVLFGNTRLRLVFVSPQSPYLAQRVIEDNMGHDTEEILHKKQNQSVVCCIQFYKCLKARYQAAINNNSEERPKGIVQIKLTEFCPYITIERYDNDIYWGLYTADTAGEFAPIFLTSLNDNYILYDKLKNHFTGLLNKDFNNGDSPKDNFLIKMESGEPWLNRELANNILGAEVVKNLLGEK